MGPGDLACPARRAGDERDRGWHFGLCAVTVLELVLRLTAMFLAILTGNSCVKRPHHAARAMALSFTTLLFSLARLKSCGGNPASSETARKRSAISCVSFV